MEFNSPDLNTFKAELDSNISTIKKLKSESHAIIKIQSMLNITVYVLATRFLEGSVKHIIYNCCKMKGHSSIQLVSLDSHLKSFNNPEYTPIREIILEHLDFDINEGLEKRKFIERDISFLNEIVRNRHRNVHATFDPSQWYDKNIKDVLNDFTKEYPGLLNILKYIDSIKWNKNKKCFIA